MLLKSLNLIMEEHQLNPFHQVGFRAKHYTIDQIHRLVNVIEKTLEEEKVCVAILLDVAQAFNKVYCRGLKFKMHTDLLYQYVEILKSHIV